MNRFKKVLRRSSGPSSTNVAPLAPPSPPPDPPTRLSIAPDQVSAHEQRLFSSQWIELDPFNLGYVNLDTVCAFLRQNILPPLIPQLVDLFIPFIDEWDQGQVYALFRLTCHVKKGRQVNADLIYLPAPPQMDLSKNRSLSDTLISVPPSLDQTHQRFSVDVTLSPPPLLLMEAFAPSPAKKHAILLNARPNSAHQPPPPVPPQHTKPDRLSHCPMINHSLS